MDTFHPGWRKSFVGDLKNSFLRAFPSMNASQPRPFLLRSRLNFLNQGHLGQEISVPRQWAGNQQAPALPFGANSRSWSSSRCLRQIPPA